MLCKISEKLWAGFQKNEEKVRKIRDYDGKSVEIEAQKYKKILYGCLNRTERIRKTGRSQTMRILHCCCCFAPVALQLQQPMRAAFRRNFLCRCCRPAERGPRFPAELPLWPAQSWPWRLPLESKQAVQPCQGKSLHALRAHHEHRKNPERMEVFAHVGRPGPRAFGFPAVPLKAAHGQFCDPFT